MIFQCEDENFILTPFYPCFVIRGGGGMLSSLAMHFSTFEI